MANPVFSRAEAFQPRGNPYGQPAYAGQGYRAQYGVSGQPGGESGSLLDGPQGQSAERAMTFDDVLGRTGLVLLIIAAIGAVSFTLIGPNVVASGPALVSDRLQHSLLRWSSALAVRCRSVASSSTASAKGWSLALCQPCLRPLTPVSWCRPSWVLSPLPA